MRFESQIPGEATKGFSVISAEVPYTECLKGRKLWVECVFKPGVHYFGP